MIAWVATGIAAKYSAITLRLNVSLRLNRPVWRYLGPTERLNTLTNTTERRRIDVGCSEVDIPPNTDAPRFTQVEGDFAPRRHRERGHIAVNEACEAETGVVAEGNAVAHSCWLGGSGQMSLL